MSPNAPVPGRAATADAESFSASALSLSLTVKDLQKSLSWYRDVVGFAVDRMVERDGKLRGVALKSGPVRILINQDDGAKGWERIKGEGFSVQLTTEQSIDAVAGRIKARGGKLETEPTDMPWGARVFRLRDPDGYKLSISSPRPA